MKKLLIGIDLGTTYSCAAVLNDAGTIEVSANADGKNTTPSVFYIKKDNDSVIVGHNAKSAIQGLISLKKDERIKQMKDGWYVHPKGTKAVVEQAKRFIGGTKTYEFNGDKYNPTLVSAAILKKIKQDVEESYGQKIDEAVITIPAKWNNQARQETVKAANSVGLNVEHIINEPTAAALAYSVNSQVDGIYVIYDFGGGTFDCSVVETKGDKVKILGHDGVKKLGGKDFDLKLLELVQKKYKDATNKDLSPRQYSIIQAEDSKIHLSTDTDVEIFIDGTEIIITRKEFEAAISTLVSSSMLTFDNAIEAAKISVDNIMDVILVGGTSRVPKVKREIKKRIGKMPKTYGNPDETVAKGAAIYVALKNKESLNINQKAVVAGFEVKEITNVFLGTIAVNSEIMKKMNKTLIKKGARIPASKTETFYMPQELVMYQIEMIANSLPYQTRMPKFEMKVTESYSDTTAVSNVKIVWKKETPWPNLQQSDIKETHAQDFMNRWMPIKVKYSIDHNQVFHVKVRHPATNTTMIDEKLDMKKGSLAIKGDKFKID